MFSDHGCHAHGMNEHLPVPFLNRRLQWRESVMAHRRPDRSSMIAVGHLWRFFTIALSAVAVIGLVGCGAGSSVHTKAAGVTCTPGKASMSGALLAAAVTNSTGEVC